MSTSGELLTITQVREITTLPLSSIYKLIDTGGLPHYRVGRRIFIRRSTLERWLDEQEHAADGPTLQTGRR